MLTSVSRLMRLGCAIMASALLLACSDGNDTYVAVTEPEYLPVPNPVMSLPPDEGGINLLAENFDLASVGYQQAEYFLEGNASAYTNVSELGVDGFWTVEAGEQAAYKTRIVVKRPIDPADFNGNVLVEWLNVTAGFETPKRAGDDF